MFKQPQIIRSSKHSLQYLNKEKKESIIRFIKEYRRVVSIIIDDICQQFFNVDDVPEHLDYSTYKSLTWLSSRILRRVTDQSLQLLRSFLSSSPSDKKCRPDTENINVSLDSNCYNSSQESKHFDEFLSIRCIGEGLKIPIPICYHSVYHKWNKKGKRLGGIELNEDYIKINFQIEEHKKIKGNIRGADQGIKTLLTLSDGQVTPLHCCHGHSLKTIINKVGRKESGSKNFHKAIEHRKNFINWSINQLNFSSIKELRIEDLTGLKSHKSCSKEILHWVYPVITGKVVNRCKEEGVLPILQGSIYRSQRCSQCGLVKKQNRKGKIYSCNNCNYEVDADFNAAKNHEVDLPIIPCFVSLSKLNKIGFYWLESGLFNYEGGSIIQSPPTKNHFIKLH